MRAGNSVHLPSVSLEPEMKCLHSGGQRHASVCLSPAETKKCYPRGREGRHIANVSVKTGNAKMFPQRDNSDEADIAIIENEYPLFGLDGDVAFCLPFRMNVEMRTMSVSVSVKRVPCGK
ncbi:hypothetical protein T4E_5656 [Trichinella pseudospiralis]|uniref:Uncharacterized protein n=1 Tax=Trichinella pseudospiralis TaxID=6337 RepID=A0A0V0YGC7_TRIPS|nr:hypothetical protein T4E_11722 [Trichinella pseudospiralis]KRX99384.1 hypothetical protein T4E_5656 [Trichinella pseudospiralis]